MSLSMSQLYDERHILTSVAVAGRDELFHLLARTLAEREEIDEKKVFEGIWEREAMMSTLIAPGIAFPHMQLEGLGKAAGILAVIPEGCDFGGNRVKVAALLVDDPRNPDLHQDLLRRFAALAKNPRFLEKLSTAGHPTQVHAVITKLEMTN